MAVADLSSLSAVWESVFDSEHGDFTVIVESDGTSAQFIVLGALLEKWSDVFAAMLLHDMEERRRRSLTITDHSVTAVRCFLKFLYTGILDASPTVLVQVASLADKYNVEALQALAEQSIEKLLTAQTACAMYEAALAVGLASAERRTLAVILRDAPEALHFASGLRPEALERVLGSPALCIDDFTLARILLGWAESRSDVAALLEAHVHFSALTDEQYVALESAADAVNLKPKLQEFRSKVKRGRPTSDAFKTLWDMYEEQFPSAGMRPPFLGYWLNVIPNRASLFTNLTLHTLEQFAKNDIDWGLSADDEVRWFMPHHSIFVHGISFYCGGSCVCGLPEVAVSRDGQEWAVIFNPQALGELVPVRDHVTPVVPCRASDEGAKWLRLRVSADGWTSQWLHVHGVIVSL